MIKKFLFIIIAFLLICSNYNRSFCDAKTGTYTADILTMGVGARAVSMGEAYSVSANDASALFWNPSALTRIENRSVTFMHALYIESSFFDYLAYAQKFGLNGALGVSLHSLSYGEIPRTDISGTETGSFTPNDTVISLGYARKLDRTFLEGFSLGISVKSVQLTIVDMAQTAAADIGVLSPAYLNEKLSFALTFSNIGGDLKFGQTNERLPARTGIGIAYNAAEKWLIELDLVLSKPDSLGLGTEYIFSFGETWSLAGRLGFNSTTQGSLDGLSGISAGFGLTNQRLAIDYGLVPMGPFGITHRLSLTYKL
jgi:hypothetical protein